MNEEFRGFINPWNTVSDFISASFTRTDGSRDDSLGQ
jgi:hypothetical protein